MNILVTGAKGFVGKNLVSFLHQLPENHTIYEYDRDSSEADLDKYTSDCKFVFHLAGVNRPENNSEFMTGNFGFTDVLLSKLKEHHNKASIMISSSIQATLDNDYGRSKKAGEDLIFAYGKEQDVPVYVYRFPNLFGKWCRPNYNSVIATFCNNIAHGKEITINDESKELTLAYIDDVCEELIRCLNGNPAKEGEFCIVPITHIKKLGEIADTIGSFKYKYNGIFVPETGDEFIKKLYATYTSYLEKDDLIVDLVNHEDHRGNFCELIRTEKFGQVSISTTKPNIERGKHYHHTKIERFMVIKGQAKISFEHIVTHEKMEITVSDEKLQYVTIPVGYEHKVENIGKGELVLLMWASELYDGEKSDTYTLQGGENG